jgi:NADH dehydrogenase
MVTVVKADIHDARQLAGLVHGHDVVINLVAILHGDQAAFERSHVVLPRLLAQTCINQGVRRLVHVSALGADLHGPSLYQRSKAQGEAALQSGVVQGLALTVLRPSVIFGEDDAFINLFAKLQAFTPVVPLAGANTLFQPVWVQDVAKAIVHAVQHPDTMGQVYELVGPQVFTLKQLVAHAGAWSGHPSWVFGLPPALAYVQALLMESLPGPPLMSRDNLASMQVSNVASGHLPGLAQLGVPNASSLSGVFPIDSAAGS